MTNVRKREKDASTCCIGIVLVLMGGGFTVLAVLVPMVRYAMADDWVATPCTIEEREVRTSSREGSDTRNLYIRYSYTYESKTFEGDDYSFCGCPVGSEISEEMLRQYAPNASAICYVNPNRIWQSVLDKRYAARCERNGKVGLGFLLAGLLAGGHGLWVRRRRRAKALRSEEAEVSAPELSQMLASRLSPMRACLQEGVKAAFLIGLFFLFLHSFDQREASIPERAFLGLLAFLSLFLIVNTLRLATLLSTPRATIRLEPSYLRPGEVGRITWTLDGAIHTVDQLLIAVEGVELLHETRDDAPHTSERVLVRIPLVETAERGAIPTGTTAFTLPDTAPHSSHGGQKEILWQVSVGIEVHGASSTQESFVFQVRPPDADDVVGGAPPPD